MDILFMFIIVKLRDPAGLRTLMSAGLSPDIAESNSTVLALNA